METKKINRTQLQDVITRIKGCQFVTIDYNTTPKMNKRGNPLNDNDVRKNTIQNCQIGYSYENAVNNRIESADREFKAETLPWGEWIIPNILIGHNNKLYLRAYKAKGAKVIVNYTIDNEPATAAEIAIIKQFTPEKKESTRQAEYNLEGEDQVMPFNIELTNINVITMNKVRYEII